jgi:hypothetical protein
MPVAMPAGLPACRMPPFSAGKQARKLKYVGVLAESDLLDMLTGFKMHLHLF